MKNGVCLCDFLQRHTLRMGYYQHEKKIEGRVGSVRNPSLRGLQQADYAGPGG